ncbi:glutamate--cysteine ligase [Tepidimicrobium xylanilyticum]|uniref:Glutamate--cysteine ligase n=1 Tax=Tepidimicrobium xylanilyticum TaxID=1123352 RepID=A0A1H3AUE7_9FIRM|nr:glutamate-cysteine ligase family protein [Tepidimicrobium xylanilyticum]GMG97664.1 glutamate--cysteine ligase [Tepidimicrobium xylanilyticum]SDX33326.1 glutamate--cysteine ligase [Tepidimicrobium xylanilyticum]
MDYNKQIREIASYFKANEKSKEDFKIGMEFEHFVIDKESLETISYYGESGVEETLKELEKHGWNGEDEGEYLLSLRNGNKVITLEPGSQLEFSVKPQKNIEDLEKEYMEFLNQIIPILDRKNQGLIAIGYHPVTRIDQIKLLPKKRYDYMFEYFKTKGTHAHNMMKGTASLQVAIDYKSEKDYIKKFKVANALSPVLYAMFDNGYYFEGKRWDRFGLRAYIWENCDKDRSGIVKGTFDEDFGYNKYAEYILNGPPIFIDDGKRMYYTGNKLVKEIFDPDNYSIEELEHILTMFFPDVRTKKYIEIRMMDSVPYPLNFAALALIKGIFYNEKNLDEIYKYIKDINMDDVVKAKMSIFEKGLEGQFKNRSIYEMGSKIIKMAKDGLDSDEKKYILPLESMFNERKNPYRVIEEKEQLGRKESVNWCILNHLIGGNRYGWTKCN